jgi:excisionase family DNA binding protein
MRHHETTTFRMDGDAPCEAPALLPDPIAVRIPEAMRLTGIGRSKLYELIASGDIETAKVGTCTLITFISLRKLIERAKR